MVPSTTARVVCLVPIALGITAAFGVNKCSVFASMLMPALLQTAARLAQASRHPLATALAREAQSTAPFAGTIEEPGQGVRAVVDGVEARLGSASFVRQRRILSSFPHRRESRAAFRISISATATASRYLRSRNACGSTLSKPCNPCAISP